MRITRSSCPQLVTLEVTTGSASTALWRDYTLPLQQVAGSADGSHSAQMEI